MLLVSVRLVIIGEVACRHNWQLSGLGGLGLSALLPAFTTSAGEFPALEIDGVTHGGFRPGNRVALVFQARCSVWMRLMGRARSAWAADTGSLARTTRLPEVRFSRRLTSDARRADTLRMALSYMLAVPTRKIDCSCADSLECIRRRPSSAWFWISVSKTLCAICSILAGCSVGLLVPAAAWRLLRPWFTPDTAVRSFSVFTAIDFDRSAQTARLACACPPVPWRWRSRR